MHRPRFHFNLNLPSVSLFFNKPTKTNDTPKPPPTTSKFPRPLLLLHQIFYSTSFALTSLLLATTLLISPADHIYQAFRANRLDHVIVVAGCYLLTLVVAVVVYASRMFRTRARLAGVMGRTGGRRGRAGIGGRVRGVEEAVWFGGIGGGGGYYYGYRYAGEGGEGDGRGKKRRRSRSARGEKGAEMKLGVHVCEQVEDLVRFGWARSAKVAFLGRPRDVSLDVVESEGLDGHAAAATTTATAPLSADDARGTQMDSLPTLNRKSRQRMGTLKEMDGELRVSTIGGSVLEEEDNLEPQWGEIRHPGWSWDSKLGLKGVQFEAVITELGGLVEAKAVSLAPLVGDDGNDDWDNANGQEVRQGDEGRYEGEEEEYARKQAMVSDPLVVNLLQRSVAMGLRDYIVHLTTLSMIHPPDLGQEFVGMYEQARFSGEAVGEDEFEVLMGLFAEILRGMKPVEREVVEGLRARAEAELIEDEEQDELDAAWDNEDGGNDDDDDDDNDGKVATDAHSLASNATVNRTPRPPSSSPLHDTSSTTDSSDSTNENTTTSTRNNNNNLRTHPPTRPRPHNHRYTSAKSTTSTSAAAVNNTSLKSKSKSKENQTMIRSSDASSTTTTTTTTSSRSSLIAKKSPSSEAGGSVIRLAMEDQGPLLDLPYEFVVER